MYYSTYGKLLPFQLFWKSCRQCF